MSDRLREAHGLHQAGRLTEAAGVYREILTLDPNHFGTLYSYGLLHLQTGQFQEAEKVLRAAASLNSSSSDVWSMLAAALQNLGRHEEAIASLDKVIELRPGHALTWNNRGNILLETGRIEEAMRSYDRAVTLKTDYAEAWHNRAVARIQMGDYPAAESDLDRALLLKRDYAVALEHRGVVRALQGRHEEALADYDAALTLQQPTAALHCARADLLLGLGRLQDAVAQYDQALALNRSEAHAWHNRGVALSRLERFGEALESYDLALRLKPDLADAWRNRGSTLLALQMHSEALSSYDRALAIAPGDVESLKSRGVLLIHLQRYADALADFERAVSLRPNDADAWHGRGNVLARLNHHDAALASFDAALRLQPGDAATLYNRASLLSQLKRYEEAARDAEALIAIDPDYTLARGILMHVRLHVCDWRGFEQARQEIAAALHAGRRAIHPFEYLTISESPAEQLLCARISAAASLPVSSPLYRGEPFRHEKIRIAYLSEDFYAHAVAFLSAGVFEHHDRDRFETFGISYGPDDKGEMRARMERAFTRFIDVREAGDAEIASMLREMEIDIAVDLKGYTGGARPGILNFRPAPVQVHYLGYPGTMGTDCIDYLIADPVVVPEEHRPFYSEQIAYLPDTYQSNDSKRRIAARVFDRAEAGLPGRGFVFCCFNGSQKILPDIFRIWMSILGKVEGSVLWLLEEHPSASVNLRREAQSFGIAPERLVFAKRVSLEDHLARLKLADLVLDTLPYCAHTTASDALWAGVPVLTRLGTTFAGRVGASLLHAIGATELITHSASEYEKRACELAHDAPLLAGIRTKLARNREAMPLFDTARITRNLEAAYVEMWNRHRRGERPASFAIGAPK